MRQDDVVVITASNSWTDQRMADHQLTAALSRHVRIVFVDPSGVRRPSVEQLAIGVTVLRSLRMPFIRLGVTRWASRRLIAWQIRRVVRRLNPTRVVLLEGNVLFPVSGLIGEDAAVYWAQDDWSGLAAIFGLPEGVLDGGEQHATAGARAVIAANPLVAERLRASHERVHLIPFGASTSLFSTAGQIPVVDDRHPAVLMGTLNSRIDFDLLDALVADGVPLLIAGPVDTPEAASRLADLLRTGLVEHLGAVDFENLPAVLARCSVGLVPYGHSRFNEGSFPLKTIEYLAAGLPVVATDLPAIRWLSADEVHVADDPAAFASTVREQWLRGVPQPADRERRRAQARSHDWRNRADLFAAVLDDACRGALQLEASR